ncbi:endo-1,4-beta-xylanase, partial [Trichodelitschia bisporula]
DGESIYFAVSNGNNPLNWTETKNGKPYLASTVGTRGVRDPTIIRAHDGSKFWILATDLKMNGKGDWGAASKHGSRNIVVWESSDLKQWSGPRLVQVSPPTVGNTWAPEAIYDTQRGHYLVFWASTLYPANDPSHGSSSYHRILRATTKDFKTFTPAETYIDTGFSVIDTTIVYDERSARYYRFSKDERAQNAATPNGKFIFQESSDSLMGNWRTVKVGIGKGPIARGEGPLVFASNSVRNKVGDLFDKWTGRGYVPFESTDIASGNWIPSRNYQLPKRPRHGSVIPMYDDSEWKTRTRLIDAERNRREGLC